MSDDNKDNRLKLFLSKKPKASADNSSTGSQGLGASLGAAGAKLKQKDVRKRWIYVGAGMIALVVFSSTMLSDKQKAPRGERERASSMISVTPPNADKAAFEAKYSQDLELFKTRLEKLSRDNVALTLSLKQTQEKLDAQSRATAAGAKANAEPPSGVVPPPVFGGGDNSGGIGSLGPSVPPPPPFAPLTPPRIPSGIDTGGYAPPAPESFQEPLGEPIVFELSSKGGEGNGLQSQEVRTQFKKNPNAGLIPAGSFAPVVLLNGLDAGTSAATQSNPMPVLMTITDQATLPGSSRYQLKSCFVLGNGYGELSAERVYVRFNRISCVDKKDRLVLSQEVAGYLVDSDGKLGLRGKVSDRQGARLGKSVIAGFAQGLTGALGQSQSTITSNLGTGNTMSSITGGAALKASGLSGAQAATQQIAEFYLREAQSIFPVITIDNGRKGTIVFTNSAPLNWGDGDSKFVKDVSPL